jgi:putative ABC transport system permease protein
MAPAVDGRNPIERPTGDSSRKRRQTPFETLFHVVQVEGQDIPAHAKLRHNIYRESMLPARQGGGRFLIPTDRGQPVVVISTRLAKQFPDTSGRPRRVGDTLKLGRREFTIVGLYDTHSAVFDSTFVMEIGTARALFGLSDDTVSCYHVEPEDPDRMEDVAAAIEQRIPHVDARTARQFADRVRGLLGRLDHLLVLLLGLAMAVGAIGIVNTMFMSVSERTSEFGVMRANGWSRLDVGRLVLMEGGLIGLAAGTIGVILALAAVPLVNRLFEGDMRLALAPAHLATGLILSTALGLLGGLLPDWRASHLRPIDAIRQC